MIAAQKSGKLPPRLSAEGVIWSLKIEQSACSSQPVRQRVANPYLALVNAGVESAKSIFFGVDLVGVCPVRISVEDRLRATDIGNWLSW